MSKWEMGIWGPGRDEERGHDPPLFYAVMVLRERLLPLGVAFSSGALLSLINWELEIKWIH